MKAYSYKPIFKQTVLKNGLRVVSESHPFTRAVAIGIFVDVGTRDEKPSVAGASHFLEHLVFKGTHRRSAYELAQVLEAVGGDLNAYTSRENTCFHATSLKEHLDLSLDVLTDLVCNAKLGVDDFEKERDVIRQEVEMSRESLEEYILDVYLEHVFKGHPLATSILGTEESLAKMRRRDILKHYKDFYRGPNIVVAVSGAIEHDELVEKVEKRLGGLPGRVKKKSRSAPRPKVFQQFMPRPSEQVHLLVGMPSCSYKSKFRFESYVVNDMLGGGVTSRFYQKIREQQGLAYSVHSFLQTFNDAGLLLTYAGVSPKNSLTTMRSLQTELKRFLDRRVKESELETFKTQVKGQILLGAEDMENRMTSLGINELVFGQYRPVDLVIDEIEAVQLKTVNQYIDQYLDLDKVSVLVMGDIEAKLALSLLSVFE